jgi:hypothetical protein
MSRQTTGSDVISIVGSESETQESLPNESRAILKDTKTGRFVKGTGGRPKGAVSKSTIAKQIILDAAPELVKQAIELAKGNASMMATLLAIALPTNRSQLEPVAIPDIENCTTLEEKTDAIMTAVTNGIISPDVGLQMVSGLEKSEQAHRLRLLSEQVADLQRKVIEGRNLVRRIN